MNTKTLVTKKLVILPEVQCYFPQEQIVPLPTLEGILYVESHPS